MKLLKQLYEIYSPSGKEDKMMAFLKAECLLMGAKVVEDAGNLYALKGEAETYPCVVAHTDQVQSAACRAFQAKDIVFGLSLDGRSFQGLGADDKNGIWIALKCLQTFDTIKVAFFREEETGCRGSAKATVAFFDNCRFVIQCDRKGGKDFINRIGGMQICSEEFVKDAKIKDFGFKKETGMMTDVQKLRNLGVKVSCCNISCGYYEPHSAREYTILPELKNTLAFVKSIIRNCTKVYEYKEPVRKAYNDGWGYNGGGYSGGYNGGGYSGGYGGGRTLWDRVSDLEDVSDIHEQSISDLLTDFKNLSKRVAGLEKQALKKGKVIPTETVVTPDDLPIV